MKTNFRRWLSACSAVIVILILFVSSAALLRPMLAEKKTVSVFSQSEAQAYASFSPSVLDGQTKLPIENAVIVIPEEDHSCTTDAEGKAEIRLPYHAQSSETLQKDWLEVTLLVYAEGYAPYALFHLQLRENTLRQGPTVLLFPDRGKPFSIIEGPPEEWVEQLTERYRP